MFETVLNSTYYNTEDIVAVLEAARINGRSSLVTMLPALNQTLPHPETLYNELHVRLSTSGESKVEVHTEKDRLVVSIQRRTNIYDNDLDRIASLSVESPKVPESLVVRLYLAATWHFFANDHQAWTGIKQLAGAGWGVHNRKRAWAETLVKSMPKGMEIQIADRANPNAKHEARRVQLKDRIARRASTLKWKRSSVEELEKKLAIMQTKVRDASERLNKDIAELAKLEEE